MINAWNVTDISREYQIYSMIKDRNIEQPF